MLPYFFDILENEKIMMYIMIIGRWIGRYISRVLKCDMQKGCIIMNSLIKKASGIILAVAVAASAAISVSAAYTDAVPVGPAQEIEDAYISEEIMAEVANVKSLLLTEVPNTPAMDTLEYYIAKGEDAAMDASLTKDQITDVINKLKTVYQDYNELLGGKDSLSAELNSVNKLIADYPEKYGTLTESEKSAISQAEKVLNNSQATANDYADAYVVLHYSFYSVAPYQRYLINELTETKNAVELYFGDVLTSEIKNSLAYADQRAEQVKLQDQITNKDLLVLSYLYTKPCETIDKNSVQKADLEKAISVAKNVSNNGIYTDDSYRTFENSISSAESIYESSQAASGDYYDKIMDMVTAFTGLKENASSTKFGDVDGDGTVALKDISLAQQYISENTTLSPLQIELADVDSDGKVTLKDCNLIQKYVSEKIDTFPVEG